MCVYRNTSGRVASSSWTSWVTRDWRRRPSPRRRKRWRIAPCRTAVTAAPRRSSNRRSRITRRATSPVASCSRSWLRGMITAGNFTNFQFLNVSSLRLLKARAFGIPRQDHINRGCNKFYKIILYRLFLCGIKCSDILRRPFCFLTQQLKLLNLLLKLRVATGVRFNCTVLKWRVTKFFLQTGGKYTFHTPVPQNILVNLCR